MTTSYYTKTVRKRLPPLWRDKFAVNAQSIMVDDTYIREHATNHGVCVWVSPTLRPIFTTSLESSTQILNQHKNIRSTTNHRTFIKQLKHCPKLRHQKNNRRKESYEPNLAKWRLPFGRLGWPNKVPIRMPCLVQDDAQCRIEDASL